MVSKRKSGQKKAADKNGQCSIRHKKAKSSKLPVTLLSGFLGAGKTTLLKHILESDHGKRIAVIVNDMAALNIDAALIKHSGLVQVRQEIVELQNGCICCTLRQDLVREIEKLCKLKRFDYLVIESTGISEPMHVAESFTFAVDEEEEEGEEGHDVVLSDIARLDTCVTVIDSFNFAADALSLQTMKERFNEGGNEEAEGERHIGHLLIDQIEFADVIILNKTDLASEADVGTCEAAVRALNPSARVLRASHSRVDVSEVLDTGLFALQDMERVPGWLAGLKDGEMPPAPESEEYGVGHFIYRARRPFHPARLAAWLRSVFVLAEEIDEQSGSEGREDWEARKAHLLATYGCLLRSKGFTWIGGEREAVMTEWEQCGRVLSLKPLGQWYSDQSKDALAEQFSGEELAALQKSFENGTDRRQELVFIGSALNREAITSALDAALVTDAEVKRSKPLRGCVHLADPLPQWRRELAAGFFGLQVPHKTTKLLLVAEGWQLTVQCVALQTSAAEGWCRVWCSSSSTQDSSISVAAAPAPVLLCTLRPGRCEQTSLAVDFPAVEGPLEVDVWLEVSDTWTGSADGATCEHIVHLVGVVEAVHTDDAEEGDSEE